MNVVSLITVATRGRCGVSDQGADHRAVRAHAQKHNHKGLNGTLTFSFPFISYNYECFVIFLKCITLKHHNVH